MDGKSLKLLFYSICSDGKRYIHFFSLPFSKLERLNNFDYTQVTVDQDYPYSMSKHFWHQFPW